MLRTPGILDDDVIRFVIAFRRALNPPSLPPGIVPSGIPRDRRRFSREDRARSLPRERPRLSGTRASYREFLTRGSRPPRAARDPADRGRPTALIADRADDVT